MAGPLLVRPATGHWFLPVAPQRPFGIVSWRPVRCPLRDRIGANPVPKLASRPQETSQLIYCKQVRKSKVASTGIPIPVPWCSAGIIRPFGRVKTTRSIGSKQPNQWVTHGQRVRHPGERMAASCRGRYGDMVRAIAPAMRARACKRANSGDRSSEIVHVRRCTRHFFTPRHADFATFSLNAASKLRRLDDDATRVA